MMTNLLEKAFKLASELPDDDQNALAQWLLADLSSDRQWARAFHESQDALGKLADEALADFSAGRTEEVDPEKL